MDRDQSRPNSSLRPSNKSNGESADGNVLAGVSELYQVGVKYHEVGRLNEAERCYQEVLAVDPRHAGSLHLLGVIACQGGRVDLAVDLIGKALEIKPDFAEAHCNLGNALKEQGRLDEAIASYRKALNLKPGFLLAYSNLAAVLLNQSKLDEAVACYRNALALKPNIAELHCNLGEALQLQGKLDEAAAGYRKALELKPDFPLAYSNLGTVLMSQGNLDEAVACYRNSLNLKPDFAEAHYNLGNTLMLKGKLDEAVACYRDALRIKPDLAEAHGNLGSALLDLGEPAKAAAECCEAIRLNPNLVSAHGNLGIALTHLGQFSDARASLAQAVNLAPQRIKYRRHLGDVTDYVAGDSQLEALEQLTLASDTLSVDDRIHLHFSLAKAYKDLGRHAAAFRQLLDGSALKRQQIAYDESRTLGYLRRTQEVFTSELTRTQQNAGDPSSVPVFIVGMPRSGTTLVEQILASHPQVFGGGELRYFYQATEESRAKCGGAVTFPELVSGMTSEDYRDLGGRYVAKIERLALGATHVTDKFPGNFIPLGLIHLSLPNAPIIHTIRDPVDTCISCFSTFFAEGHEYKYDLAELGRYYRHYQALMAHWSRVLPPGRILEVQYEDVVHDLEGQARRIVAHCGLDWDPRCLRFHETSRAVRTASSTQVRKPIYDSSIGRWRAYESFLGPLFAELGVANDVNRNRTEPTSRTY